MSLTATSTKPCVFISYRREDAAGWAGRIEDDLTDEFGADRVWRDIKIPASVDYEQHIDTVLDACHVVVVVIGPHWSTLAGADGRPRLHRDDDLLRKEIRRALERRDVDVFPVLVQNARMPEAQDLPADLRPLVRRQATELSDRRWRHDVMELVAELRTVLEDTTGFRERPGPAPAPKPVPEPVRERRARLADPVDVSSLPARTRGIAAAAMAFAAALGVLVALPLTEGFVERRHFTAPAADRLVHYAAERAVIWALVTALVLAAAATTLRGHRAGTLAYAIVGLGVGAIAGALSGATYMGLKDNDIIVSEHLLRGITMAIAGIALAAVLARLLHGQRSVYMLAGLAGGLLAGILAQQLFEGAAGRSSGMVLFEAILVTSAVVSVATTAAADFAGRAGALRRT